MESPGRYTYIKETFASTTSPKAVTILPEHSKVDDPSRYVKDLFNIVAAYSHMKLLDRYIYVTETFFILTEHSDFEASSRYTYVSSHITT